MDSFEEVARLIAGDGLDELIEKMTDRKKRQVTAGLSAVGAAAGGAGLALGGHNLSRQYRQARWGQKTLKAVKEAKHAGALPRTGKKSAVKTAVGQEKLATGLIPLELAGLTGEIAATKILHGDTVKKKPKTKVAKMEPGGSDLHLSTGHLKKVAAKKAYEKGKPYAKQGFNVAQKQTGKGLIKAGEKLTKEEQLVKNITWEGEISKVDEDKRQVFGWASITEVDGKPVVDLQGDMIDIDEIEKSAYDYVIKSRNAGNMHARDGELPKVVGTMIESFIVTPEKKEKMGLPDSTPTGWWVGYQVEDPDVWAMVKNGTRTGFSIHGRGNRTPVEI